MQPIRWMTLAVVTTALVACEKQPAYIKVKVPQDSLHSVRMDPVLPPFTARGDTIKLRQQKTGKLVEVPCHSELRAVLEAAKAERAGVHIVARANGTPVRRAWLTDKFKILREACGLERLLGRDLRRTAMCLMAEAGASETGIAAVSGHSIEQTRRILDTYIPRSVEMARGAIAKWERKDHRV